MAAEGSFSIHQLTQKLEAYTNMVIPYKRYRWIGAGVMSLIFILRIILSHKWYLIAYFMYIYLLSAFISFITPDTADGLPQLPTVADKDEFKPYARKMPEFDFWLTFSKAHLLCLFLTLFSFTNLPVWPPILVLYAVILTVAFIRKELARWKSLSVNPTTAVKHWVGLSKPRYAQ
eukprot:gnl/Dysnectes_brevis/488_a541_5642.p1 GENE.gnl/Dysnectes_brevis/488_a541_5642~~gnl/Dysnectes_brevis/488_a541_5642.p1  ORF type:complete len:175 (+),score=23.40 gnl/Dysnectes_brevis/488_a541_5642:44-568(+)